MHRVARTISHDTKVFSEVGPLSTPPKGEWPCYSLNHDRLDQLRSAIEGYAEHCVAP
jgi:hypothetical protein